MNEREKSDSAVVPAKSSNNAGSPAAERMEGRALAKRNTHGQNARRMQSRERAQSALERVREAAGRDKKVQFTALLHHVYAIERLRDAYRAIERDAAAGIDGVTWRGYGEQLESNLHDLSDRLRRGAYRAKPVRRAYIPKSDGRMRPLGVPALEDKIVQRATVEVLGAIYESDFLGFSYGFRPGRSQHNALDALSVAIRTKKVGWVLDADIRGFFDALSRSWMVQFIEHRIADRRVVRLIQKWLNAGVMEGGVRTQSEVGTVQGGSVSPLLANIYLHYVFDLWIQQWRNTRARGDVVVVRYADDFIVGFQHRDEAEQFLGELRERFAKFGLELHPDKTRLLEFGRYAQSNRARRGQGKPETFNFLGFTHICAKTEQGWFRLLRKTERKRRRVKLAAVKTELRRRMHEPVPEQGAYLGAVVRGHTQYYGVAGNSQAIALFRHLVIRLWHRTLCRRSQTGHVEWTRMARYVARWIPPVRISRREPDTRHYVSTRGRSRMRENRPSGSVQGVTAT
jgi:RNA-directed DNA polymerase